MSCSSAPDNVNRVMHERSDAAADFLERISERGADALLELRFRSRMVASGEQKWQKSLQSALI